MSESRSSLRRIFEVALPERGDVATVIVFGATAGALSLIVPVAVQSFVNTMAFTALEQPLVLLTVVVAAVLAIAGIARLCQLLAVEQLQRRVFARVTRRLARGLPSLADEERRRFRPSEITGRFLEVVVVQKTVATLLVDGALVLLQTFLGMVLLAFYHPTLLALDALLIVTLLLVLFGLGRGGERTAVNESKKKYAVLRLIDDLARPGHLFRATSAAAHQSERVEGALADYMKARSKHFGVLLRQNVGMLLLQVVASAALLGLGGSLVLREQLSLGQLVAAEIVVAAVVAGAARAGKYLESFFDLLASVGKLSDLLDLAVEPSGESPAPPTGASGVVMRAGGDGGNDLTIAPREHVALLGGSTHQRSAIVDALAAEKPPAHGYVAIDGIDTRVATLADLRERIALLREPSVIGASVADNVRAGRPGELSAVQRALDLVGLSDAVAALPHGVLTELDPARPCLSEDELRLLGTARAVFAMPSLLVVDGLFDALSDEQGVDLVRKLVAPTVPWTLVLATGQARLAAALPRTVQLDLPAVAERSA